MMGQCNAIAGMSQIGFADRILSKLGFRLSQCIEEAEDSGLTIDGTESNHKNMGFHLR
jgi:hypothetical protein